MVTPVKEDVFVKIVSFVESNKYNNFGIFKEPLKLVRETTLEGDLGITGDDADEFMSEFLKNFPIDIGDFDISNYFGAEGFWPLPAFKKQKTITPLTLGMLELAVINGTWDSKKIGAGR